MFDRLMKLLGLRQATPKPTPDFSGFLRKAQDAASTAQGSPPRSPQVSGGPSPSQSEERRLAMLRVRVDVSRRRRSRLEGLDAGGATVCGPWNAVTSSDLNRAKMVGNPSRDPLLPWGHTPFGAYEVVDLLPPRTDEAGISLFGAHPVLRLRPVSGDAALADSNGRTALLLHGGSPEAPTDGSIRIPDAAMAEILGRLPGNPAAMKPRLRLVVERAAATVLGDSEPSDDRYFSYPGTDDGAFPWWLWYQQMYVWDGMFEPTDDGTWGDPVREFMGGLDITDSQPGAVQDRAATEALSALGYGVVGEPTSPALTETGRHHPTDHAVSAAPEPSSVPVQPHVPGQSDMPDPTPSSDGGWEPAGGAYGR